MSTITAGYARFPARSGVAVRGGLAKIQPASAVQSDHLAIPALSSFIGVMTFTDQPNSDPGPLFRINQDGYYERYIPPASAPKPSHDPSTPHPSKVALDRALKGMNERGETFERAAGGFVADLARAFMAGDERVLARSAEYRPTDPDTGQVLSQEEY